MKVNAFKEIFRFNPSLKAQGEGEGYGQNPQERPEGERSGKRSNQQEATTNAAPAMTPEQELQAVQKAIEDFATEARTQNHGLSASLQKSQPQSPGLTIVLSDVNGNVIRSFSGGEFLRLRQGGQTDARGRGKLLDQKL